MASLGLALASLGLTKASLGLVKAFQGLALASQGLALTSQGLGWVPRGLAGAFLGLAWAYLGLAEPPLAWLRSSRPPSSLPTSLTKLMRFFSQPPSLVFLLPDSRKQVLYKGTRPDTRPA